MGVYAPPGSYAGIKVLALYFEKKNMKARLLSAGSFVKNRIEI